MDEEYKAYINNRYEVSDEFKKIVDTLANNYYGSHTYHRSTTSGSIRKVNIVDTLDSTNLGTDVAARLRSLDIKVKA
jgi:hypothetical protein